MLSKIFLEDKVVLSAIVLNAIIISLMLFPQWEHFSILHNLDVFFICFFLIEAIVKIISWGPSKYFSDWWNRFDFFLVVVSMPVIIGLFYAIPFDFSILLLFRLFRLIRLIRYLTFIPHIGSLINGIVRALKASVFVLIVLALFNVLLALFSCYLFRDISPDYFQDPLISSHTIFQLFTIEGWYEVSDIVREQAPDNWAFFIRVYFIFVVFTGGIFGLSLANAVFVDEMTMDNNMDLENKIDALTQKIDDLQKTIEQKENDQT